MLLFSTITLFAAVAGAADSLDSAKAFLTFYGQLPTCAQQSMMVIFIDSLGTADLMAEVPTLDDVIYFCLEPNSIQAFLDKSTSSCKVDSLRLSAWNSTLTTTICPAALAEDKINITSVASDTSIAAWSPYYNNTMTDYDWINLREGIKTIIQVKQYGPVFLRLAWHDSSTGNIEDGSGGPHATMLLQNPQDPQNKGLQRAIDALAPLYKQFQGKISNADLWSFAGALAVRIMGGPLVKWRPGRNDLTSLSQARFTGANRIPDAKDSYHAQVDKFAKLGLNSTDFAILVFGGHGVGRCHREYSGYHGPWTGQENTFSNFYGSLIGLGLNKTNESLPEINSWQLNAKNLVNGGMVMQLPSDWEMLSGTLDFANAPAGIPVGPNADKLFLEFDGNRNGFSEYFAGAFGRLLEVTLDATKLGGHVSVEPADPFGWIPVPKSTTTVPSQPTAAVVSSKVGNLLSDGVCVLVSLHLLTLVALMF
ncbi:hypothetical protein HDU79_011707 [Rhizoclosmatium sp. JEL0117]|nr:hypothetical protein HDU79_011707 [Rhizoclosmatium sp. JEL0117]